MTKFITGQRFKFKDGGTITFVVTRTFDDGGCVAMDGEGDTFSFEVDELYQLEKVA
jgi:hypothetical protein